MKARFILILVTLAGVCAVNCQTMPDEENPSPVPPPSEPPKFSASELEKLAMPIALHPDPLIAVILPAAVYPVEIVQAARFVKDTNNIPKVDDQPWDDSVKAVAQFPDLIAKMDADLPWTVDLGHAFLDQQQELMDTIQSLRAKAQSAGTLQTTPQQIVTVTNYVVLQTNTTTIVSVTNRIVEIQPANPQVIYVPVYPPTVYYPPPHYVYNPYAPLITFGIGVAWGYHWANRCYWRGGRVYVSSNVNINRNININRNTNINRDRNINRNPRDRGGDGSRQWQPDQNRLRNNGGLSASTRESRGWGSGANQPSTGTVGTRPSTGNLPSRPSTGTVGTRPSTGAAGPGPSTGTVGSRPSTGVAGSGASTGTVGTRPSTGQGSQPSGTTTGTRPSSTPRTGRSSSSGGSSSGAFTGVNNGSSAGGASNRGAASRSGGGRGGARGSGGR